MDIHRKSIASRSFADILNFSCCVIIELFNLKEDPMRLIKKTYLFPVQIGMLLANASKICRIYGNTYTTLFFPTIGIAVNV
jgi:hypothetical protein